MKTPTATSGEQDATAQEVETAVNEVLQACNINYRSKRTKIKGGTKLHFPLMDATGPDEEFEQDKAECEIILAKVQKMLDQRFPGCNAEQDMGRACPQSNTFLKIVIVWPPVPSTRLPTTYRRATNIDQWMSERGQIIHRPGQAETLPPTWHHVVVRSVMGQRRRWVVIGPQSRITTELLKAEIEGKTGTKIDIDDFHIYHSTYKPESRWLIANGFFTDLTGKEEARQKQREAVSKNPTLRKAVVPTQEAVKAWLSHKLPREEKRQDEPEILPACWKRLRVDLIFVTEMKAKSVGWLVIEDHPQPVKSYHEMILADLQDVLGTEKIVIRSMTGAGKDYIPVARALLKHGFFTDVPRAKAERKRAMEILDDFEKRQG